MLGAALEYLRRSWSIIPIQESSKIPIIEWKEFQTRQPTEQEVRQWWAKWPNANIGLVTGAISGIVVIDIEKGGSVNGFTATVTSHTGGDGWHLVYEHPGVPIKNSVKHLAPLTDVRGDGGYAVLPPSLHKSGKRYEWSISPDDADFAPLPQLVLDKVKDTVVKKTDWAQFASEPVHEGERNNKAASYTGKLLHDLSPDLWETEGWVSLKEWNRVTCTPLLDEKELRAVFESIREAETKNRAKQSETQCADGEHNPKRDALADKLVKLAMRDGSTVLFHDEFNKPHVRIVNGTHRETLSINSSAFKHWLSHSYYSEYKKAPNNNALEDAIRALIGQALFAGECMRLHNRMMREDSTIWYDLVDEKWRAIEITAEGWRVVENPPTLFKRQQHQAPQVEPKVGGDVRDILRFVNITDEKQQILFLVLIISYFIPGFPHPIIYSYGPQGAAKSTLSKVSRKVVDPSQIEVVSLPRKEEELVQTLAHHYLLFFDNVSNIEGWISDVLCRAVTGGGVSKRQLYTDDEDIIYNLQSNIGINGIELAAGKPDLLDRCVLFELSRVQERVDENDLFVAFEQELPKLLGAIFSALSRTLAIRPSINKEGIKPLPRMADFTIWGCAIAEAIGYTKEQFLNAYRSNIGQQNDAVLADHAVATALIDFMADRESWTGSASDLLKELKCAGENLADEMPKRANGLSKELRKLKSNLEEAGLIVKWSKGTKRTITITKVAQNIAGIVAPSFSPDITPIQEDGIGDDRCNGTVSGSPSPEVREIWTEDDKDDGDGAFEGHVPDGTQL